MSFNYLKKPIKHKQQIMKASRFVSLKIQIVTKLFANVPSLLFLTVVKALKSFE